MNGYSVILSRQPSEETPAGKRKMSPRPRETSDAEILAATARVMQRRGPAQLTLSDVAKEAGVVPATLIQRFGTKRKLLPTTCKSGAGDVRAQFAAARGKHKPALKALVELYAEGSSFAATPESMANGLAYLQNDLTDPEFRAVTLAQFKACRRETRKLLDDAVAAGELRKCDTGELARLFQQVNGGSMLDWAVFREGTLADWLRAYLEALLRPYRKTGKSRRGKRRLNK
jgi:AcrR family transcriptional regulator